MEAVTNEQGERIARLETRIEHLTDTLDKMSGKVDELHALLLQAKGARWMIVGIATAAGFVSGKLGGLWAGFLGR